MKTRSVGAALLMLAAAQAPAATRLIDAWQAALSHDPQFAAARAGHAAGQSGHDLARSVLLPKISAVATSGRASMDNTTEGAQFTTPAMGTSDQVAFRTSIHRGTLNQWSIQGSMPLIDAAAWAQSRQFDTGARLADARLRQAEQDLILRTADAFFGVQLARETVATLERQQQAIERTRKEAEARFRVGDSPVTDRLEAEAQAEEMAARVLAARSELQLKERAYRDLTGLEPQALPGINVERDASVHALPPLADWQQLAAAQAPVLTMSQLGKEAARDEIDKYRAWKSPTLSLVASVGSDRLSGSGTYGQSSITARSNMIGLQLSVPIFTGGYRSARLQEAIHQEEKAGYDLESTRQWVARETESAWLGMTLGSERVRALRLALRAQNARMKATLTGRQVGDRSTLDVLNAQSALSQTQLALQAAQTELMMNRLRLLAASGQLDERELRALDGVLQ